MRLPCCRLPLHAPPHCPLSPPLPALPWSSILATFRHALAYFLGFLLLSALFVVSAPPFRTIAPSAFRASLPLVVPLLYALALLSIALALLVIERPRLYSRLNRPLVFLAVLQLAVISLVGYQIHSGFLNAFPTLLPACQSCLPTLAFGFYLSLFGALSLLFASLLVLARRTLSPLDACVIFLAVFSLALGAG